MGTEKEKLIDELIDLENELRFYKYGSGPDSDPPMIKALARAVVELRLKLNAIRGDENA